MRARVIHRNTHVYDLEATLAFYEKALGLTERRRKGPDDGSWLIVFIGNDESDFELELTWLRDMDRPYNLGDQEFHLAFVTDDYEASHTLHSEMGCICYENTEMGIYFVEDPDGYWLEVIPDRDGTM